MHTAVTVMNLKVAAEKRAATTLQIHKYTAKSPGREMKRVV
jgi:hypothetical protein